MSITLRDVVALTGLPIRGDEVVVKFASKLDNIEKQNFALMWFLLCKYITCTNNGRLTRDSQTLALALHYGQRMALATILLSHYYQGISIAVVKDPFKQIPVFGWLIQLWLLTYFPALRTPNLTLKQGMLPAIVAAIAPALGLDQR